MKRMLWMMVVLVGICVLVLPSCVPSRGYRDQAYHALSEGGEKGAGRSRWMIGADAIQLGEFLSSYQFALPAQNGSPVTARLLFGGSGEEQERGVGYMMLALSAKDMPPQDVPPRDWVLALDGSYSMKDADKWSLATATVQYLIARLRPQDRVTLFVFGKQQQVLAERATPDVAATALSRFMESPTNSRDDHSAGLNELAHRLLHADTYGRNASGFLITDMEGAPDCHPDDMGKLAKLGLDINVIGLAGGNESLLRRVARKASGSYVFIAQKGDIERGLGEALSETFDAVMRNLSVSLWFDAPLAMEPAQDTEEIHRYSAHWQTPLRSPIILETIPRLGPGETWVRLWRVKELPDNRLGTIDVRMKGRQCAGQSFQQTVAFHPSYLTPGANTREQKALLKAVTIAREVQVLRAALQQGMYYGGNRYYKDHSHSQVMAQIKEITREVRSAQAILNDPEFARDLVALEAASKLSAEDFDRMRHGGSPFCGRGRLPLPFRVVGLPFFIIGFLLF